MKYFSFVFLVFMVFLFVSCNNESNDSLQPSSTNSFDLAMSQIMNTVDPVTDVYGSISILGFTGSLQLEYDSSSVDPDYDYELRASFSTNPQYQSGTATVDAGNISIGVFTASSTTYQSTSGPYYYNLFAGTTYDNEFGSMVTCDVSGSPDFPATVSSNFYIPDEIAFSLATPLSKSQGVTLNWNADSNNPSGQVAVWVSYEHFHYGNDDPSLSLPTGVIDFVDVVNDNGSHTISAADLANFPVGAVLSIYMGRGNATYLETNTNKYVSLRSSSIMTLKVTLVN